MATRSKDQLDKSPPRDAIAMLLDDHKKVKALFAEFKKTRANKNSDEEKTDIVQDICNELTIHATVEEEIFYPAVREAIDDASLMDEALVEHAGAKDLIAQLQDADASTEFYDAKVTVLGEQIDHHVEEEEGVMFPKAKAAKLDMAALGAEMFERKMALRSELGIEEEEEEKTGRQKERKRTAGKS